MNSSAMIAAAELTIVEDSEAPLVDLVLLRERSPSLLAVDPESSLRCTIKLTGPKVRMEPVLSSTLSPDLIRLLSTYVPLLLSRSVTETPSRPTRRKQCRRLICGAESRKLQSEPRPITISCRTVTLRTLANCSCSSRTTFMDFVPLATMKWESKHDGHEQSLGEDVRFIAGFCSGWRKRYRAPLSITRDLTQLWHQIVPILLFTLPKLNCWRIPTRFCLTSTYKRARFIKEHGRGARTAYFILLDESNFAGCHSPDLVWLRLPPNHRPQHPPPFALPFGTTMSGFEDRL